MHFLKTKVSCKPSSYSSSDSNESSPHPPSYFFQTHFSNIPHLLLCLPSGILPTDVSNKTLNAYSPLSPACYMTRPPHSPSFDHHTNNRRRTHKLRISSLCNKIFTSLQMLPSSLVRTLYTASGSQISAVYVPHLM